MKNTLGKSNKRLDSKIEKVEDNKILDLNGKGYFLKYIQSEPKFKGFKFILIDADNDKEGTGYALTNKNEIGTICLRSGFNPWFLQNGDTVQLDNEGIRGVKENYKNIFDELVKHGYVDLEDNINDLKSKVINDFSKKFGNEVLDFKDLNSWLNLECIKNQQGYIEIRADIKLNFLNFKNGYTTNFSFSGIGDNKELAEKDFYKELKKEITRCYNNLNRETSKTEDDLKQEDDNRKIFVRDLSEYGYNNNLDINHKILSSNFLDLNENLKENYENIITHIKNEFMDRLENEFGVREFDFGENLGITGYVDGLPIKNTRDLLTLMAISDLVGNCFECYNDVDMFFSDYSEEIENGDFKKGNYVFHDRGMGVTGIDEIEYIKDKFDEDFIVLNKNVDDFFEFLIELQHKQNEVQDMLENFRK